MERENNQFMYHDPQTDNHLTEVEDLYIFGSEINRSFSRVGPWHSVDAKYLDEMVDRLATSPAVPCTKRDCDGAAYYHDQIHQTYRQKIPTLSANSRNLLRQRAQSGRSLGTSTDSDTSDTFHGRRRSGRAIRLSYKPHSASSSVPSSSSSGDYYSPSPVQAVSQDQLSQIVGRLSMPTIASRGGVDIAEKFRNKDFVYGTKTDSTEDLDSIIVRVTKTTVASTGGVGREKVFKGFVYGQQKFSNEKVYSLTQRLTKPTISSRGGIDLANQKFDYIVPLPKKTQILIPGIEKRYMGSRKVNAGELRDIVNRLNQLTPAYKAKYSPNKNVWVDNSKRGPAFLKNVAAR